MDETYMFRIDKEVTTDKVEPACSETDGQRQDDKEELKIQEALNIQGMCKIYTTYHIYTRHSISVRS